MAPVFKVRSAEAVSAFLDAGIDELLLTRNIDGAPLLHVCIMRKILTPEIARKLASQVKDFEKPSKKAIHSLFFSSPVSNGVVCYQ